MQLSQSTHRQSLIEILAEDIRKKRNDESLPFATAAARVLLQWLGYELDDVTFIDGQDRGIDAWLATESGLDIFQIKTHNLTEDDLLDLSTFDGRGIHDLQRAKIFLTNEQATNVQRKELQQLLFRRDSILNSRGLQGDQVAIPITLHLVILGNELTAQAQAELQAFQASNVSPSYISEVPVQFHVASHTADNIIDEKWREDNRTWVDKNGHKSEQITLYPWNEGSISDNANAIFYCRAIDLVNAYDALGYQLFEPNVRANIKNSRVNQAIRDSVLHQRTRREFRFLNNGVTITCDNFRTPKGQQQFFSVSRPGIVNGLQTVVALYTAYQQLSTQERSDFEENCSVLVRLLLNNAVDDITRVVKATNNQNPMKPRNLLSNTIEQLTYARIFAEELGWFYEAKEGAWDAFEKDYQRWRPRLNKRPKDFKVPNSRSKVRRVDNEDLAQTWLAFIGFASEAVNDKKALFDDRFYRLVFKQQTPRHGVDYDFSLARAKTNAIDQSPSPSLMLIAYLAREFASEMIPSSTQNRQDACERLAIDPQMPKAELDALLSKDNGFILNQALGGMSVLFTEFIGFVLYRSFGEGIHHWGLKILENHSIATLATESIEVVRNRIDMQTVDPNDLVVILWFAFVDAIEDMVTGSWGQSYRAAPVKVRFVFSRETRDRLYREVENTNDFMKKRSLKKTWAIGVREGQGLFDFVKDCIAE